MRFPDHRWVNIPHTKSERRREDVVRETAFTAMGFNRKYFDIDTGKFITDKLPTIESCSLYDVFEDCVHENMQYGNYARHHCSFRYHKRSVQVDEVQEEPKFIPRDRDFDEECRKEEERWAIKRQAAEVERIKPCTKQYIITSNSRIGYIVANKWKPK